MPTGCFGDMQKQAQLTQVWQPLEPNSASNKHPEWCCQPVTQLVDSAPTDVKLHQPAAVTDQQQQQVKQSAVAEAVQRQQGPVHHQTVLSEQAGQQTKQQQQQQEEEVKQQPGLRPEKVSEKLQTGKQQHEKLPQQVADKQQTVKQQPQRSCPSRSLRSNRLCSPLSRYLQSSMQANSSSRSCLSR